MAGDAANAAADVVDGARDAAADAGDAAGDVADAAENAVDKMTGTAGETTADAAGDTADTTHAAAADEAADAADADAAENTTTTTAGEDDSSDAEAHTAIAAAPAYSLSNISRKLGGVFGTAGAVLGNVTDAESAKAALPQLESAQATLQEVSGDYARVPEGSRGALSRVVSNGVAKLKPVVDTTMRKKGVGEVLAPVVNPMMETLKGMM